MEAIEIMYEIFLNAECELEHRNPFELLIAVILSAQTADVLVSKTTPGLFAASPTPEALAVAPVKEIVAETKAIGLYRNKVENIRAYVRQLLERFNGETPQARDELASLPGMRGKTTDIVIGDTSGEPAFTADTRVERVSKRFRIYKLNTNVTEVEQTLTYRVPKEPQMKTHHTVVFSGRYHCLVGAPKREAYPLLYMCQEDKEQIRGK